MLGSNWLRHINYMIVLIVNGFVGGVLGLVFSESIAMPRGSLDEFGQRSDLSYIR